MMGAFGHEVDNHAACGYQREPQLMHKLYINSPNLREFGAMDAGTDKNGMYTVLYMSSFLQVGEDNLLSEDE